MSKHCEQGVGLVTQWQELGSRPCVSQRLCFGRQRSAKGGGREAATSARAWTDNWQTAGKGKARANAERLGLRIGSGAAHHTDTAAQDLDWPCRKLSACELAYAKTSQRAVCHFANPRAAATALARATYLRCG